MKQNLSSAKSKIVPSSYLKFLPAIYSEDEFWGRFLRLFEDILTPIEEKIEQTQYFFDSRYTPKEFMRWLASWIDVDIIENGATSEQRRLVHDLVELHCWRGTKRGLREHIKLVTGLEAHISKGPAGIILSEETILGENTILHRHYGRYHFTVTLIADDSGMINTQTLKKIIEVHCPAHGTYSLEVASQMKPSGENQ